MKVLQVLPQLNYGGVERGTVEIAHALIQSGAKAYVVSGGGRLVAEIEKIGGVHLSLPIGSKNPFIALSCLPRFKRFIHEESIEIVHARSRVPAWVAYLATRKSSVHFLTTAHGFYRPHLLSRSMVLGEKIIAVSNAVADHLIQKFRVPPQKIVVIPRGISLEEFSPPSEQEIQELRRKFHLPPDAFVAGIFARISPTKGHSLFLHTLHILHQRKIPIYGLIVGSSKGHGRYHKFLQSLIRQYQLEEYIRFTGFTENVPLYLSAVDVVVIPSSIPEAFGRSALEAMALKKPVVASAHGGVLDLVKPNETGILFSPGDSDALADALQTLLHDPEMKNRLGNAGFQLASSHFSLQQFTQKTLSVYQSLLYTR